MGTISEEQANIRYQWDHRYIPGEMKWWDWSWAINANAGRCNTLREQVYALSTHT